MAGIHVDERRGDPRAQWQARPARVGVAPIGDPVLLGLRLQEAMRGLGPVVRPPQRAIGDEPLPSVPQPAEVGAAPCPSPPDDQDDAGGGQTLAFLRAHLGVLVVVLVVALGFAVFQVTRSHAESVPVSVETAAAGTPAPEASPSPTQPPTVRVHVTGAVAQPGVITLSEGSRVVDAIEAAGGFNPDADPADLNLAAQVPDGSQVLIGRQGNPQGELRAPGVTGGAGAATAPKGSAMSAQLDLNTATAEQLDGLPGVGPVTAQRILSWRDAHGRFNSVDELQEVDGIGPKTFSQIAPHVRV